MPGNPAQRNSVFSDLDLDFDAHPNTKQLTLLKGDAAVSRAFRNLVLTNHYERPFHPEIGSNVRQLLFENILESTAGSIRNAIIETAKNFEPRIRIIDVNVIAQPDKNRYDVIVEYFIINEATARKLNFFLERIR